MNVEETVQKPKRVKMKRKLHNKMHANISSHQKRTTKSDKVNISSEEDNGYDTGGVTAETTNENRR